MNIDSKVRKAMEKLSRAGQKVVHVRQRNADQRYWDEIKQRETPLPKVRRQRTKVERRCDGCGRLSVHEAIFLPGHPKTVTCCSCGRQDVEA